MKNCPKCGELNPDRFNLCEKCGSMLDVKVETKATNVKVEKRETAPKEESKEYKKMADIETLLSGLFWNIKTIKNCVAYFTILMILNLICELIFYIRLMRI